MKFDKYKISEQLISNLHENGFIKATNIQFKTIPAILDGEDVLAIAQTGTGKTAAFVVPIIEMVHKHKERYQDTGTLCLVMVPTRELAKQIGQVFAKLSKKTKATSFAVYGGVEQDQQIAQLKGGVDILVATPGRTFDLISQGYIKIANVRVLVLDEADYMLDLGFIEDIQDVKKKLKTRHQTLFFSATINQKIKKLAYSQIKSNALRIQISPDKMISKNITHFKVSVEMDDKRHLLTHFLTANPETKTLVFVRTQVRVARVLAHLTKNNIIAECIHGGMTQEDREKNLDIYREKKYGVLIASDVSARGIDLPGITHVVNYDLPDNPENYVHRIGRTGRGFATGDAISFCSSTEKEQLKAIEELLQTEIQELKADKLLLDKIPKTSIDHMEIDDMVAMLALEEGSFAKPKKGKKAKKGKKK